jgi:hypothetical protein
MFFKKGLREPSLIQ